MRHRNRRGRARDRVGELARSASDNRSALDRERNRWLAFKRDVGEAITAAGTGGDSDLPNFRADWLRDFYSFEAFYRSNYDNIMGDLWPLSDLQAEIDEWAAVLNRYRERFRELTGREVSLPVARSGRRGRVGPSLGFSAFGTGALLLGLGAVGLLAFGGRSGG